MITHDHNPPCPFTICLYLAGEVLAAGVSFTAGF